MLFSNLLTFSADVAYSIPRHLTMLNSISLQISLIISFFLYHLNIILINAREKIKSFKYYLKYSFYIILRSFFFLRNNPYTHFSQQPHNKLTWLVIFYFFCGLVLVVFVIFYYFFVLFCFLFVKK
jgi:hypothetical protein